MPVAAAANALTTVSAVRDTVGSGPSTDYLQRLINAASQAIENYLGRPLGRATYADETPESLAGTGDEWLRVSRYPIESVEEILIGTTEVVAGTDTDEYSLTQGGAKGRIYRAAGWPRTVPATDCLTLDPDNRRPYYTITVAYTGGYLLPGAAPPDPDTSIPLPADIEQACIDEVVARYSRPTPHIASEKTPGGWERRFSNPGDAPPSRLLPATELVLAPYRTPKAWGV